MAEKGSISINTENIFPIIKKFLYSDHEIFLRELVSNAVDATQKLKKLALFGEFNGEIGETKIKVSIDKEAKTITISDAGLGMTEEEVKKYINQIAFSGAKEFLEKYKDKAEGNEVIGQFGLGFYSAFMVAAKVELITKSFKDEPAVQWICDGSTSYEINEAVRETRGTDVILHIAEDAEEFLETFRIQSILDKYAKFLPIEIEFEEKIINNPNPVWTKSPADLTDADYLSFYKELYPMSEDPLFWIHLNVDYPFNLTGVLYFPKMKNDFQLHREKIQLYSRQVFITDEVKDVVPEYLMMLHGVLDSPDIPLNVSRSYLQADGNVKKINGYISKKVADKLVDLFKEDRTAYDQKWESIGTFVKYGTISDEKFFDRAKEIVLLKNTDNQLFTIDEYRSKIETLQVDKDKKLVHIYTNDAQKQDTFVQSAKRRGYDVLSMDNVLDSHFINTLESKLENVSFKRVDADGIEKLIEKDLKLESVLSEDNQNKVKAIFEGIIANPAHQISVEAMPADEMPVSITFTEFMRRWQDMSKISGQQMMFGEMPTSYQIVVNGNSPVIDKLLNNTDENEQKAAGKQLYDLALLSQGLLNGAELTAFIQQSIAKV
jgi:molecular chaperone HtpG